MKGFTGIDLATAYEAVRKDATVPPVDDWNISYAFHNHFTESRIHL